MRVGTSSGGQHMVDTVRTRRTHYEVLGLKPTATGDEIARRSRGKWAVSAPQHRRPDRGHASPTNLARSRQTPGLRCLARPPAEARGRRNCWHGRAWATPPSVARRSRPASSRSPIRSRRPLPVPSRRPLPVPSSSRLLPTHRRQSRRWSHSIGRNRRPQRRRRSLPRRCANWRVRSRWERPLACPGRRRHRRKQRRRPILPLVWIAIFAPRWTNSWPRPRKGPFPGSGPRLRGAPWFWASSSSAHGRGGTQATASRRSRRSISRFRRQRRSRSPIPRRLRLPRPRVRHQLWRTRSWHSQSVQLSPGPAPRARSRRRGSRSWSGKYPSCRNPSQSCRKPPQPSKPRLQLRRRPSRRACRSRRGWSPEPSTGSAIRAARFQARLPAGRRGVHGDLHIRAFLPGGAGSRTLSLQAHGRPLGRRAHVVFYAMLPSSPGG